MMQFRWREAAASVILCLSLLAMPDAVRAQQVDSMHIAVGSRVLVQMRDGTQEQWRFEAQSPDSVTLSRRQLGGVLIHAVPWAAAERIDVQVSEPPSPRRVLVGSIVGAGVGYAIAFVGASHGTCHFDSGDCPQLGWAVATPGIVAAGALVGGIEGYVSRHHYWSTVWRASGR